MELTRSERAVLAKRAIFRANSGLHFLDQCLILIHRCGTDAAFSRSLYILFSFNFELILKSCLLLSSGLVSKKDLKSHDLEKLSKKLTSEELCNIGIEYIQKRNSGFIEYVIKTADREIIFQDLVDVRYDFEKNNLRSSDYNESNRMRDEIKILLEMTKKIMKMLSDINQG